MGGPIFDRLRAEIVGERVKLEPHRVGGERSHWENRAFARRTLKLGFEVAESTVSKYMIRRRHPPSQSWRTFLRNHAEAIAAIDLCVVPTVYFERLFAFVIISHGRRQLLWFTVTRHPTAEWLAQQIVEAFPWETAPTYLVRDNDGAYGPTFRRRVRAMGIRDRPISSRTPWQNPYAERLIGTLRRDCLDHVLIFGVRHLQRILTAYTHYHYYNQTRTHLSLDKDGVQWLGGGRDRKRDGQHRSRSVRAVRRRDRAVHRLNEAARDCEPEAGSRPHMVALLRAEELVENVLQVRRRNALAFVDDLQRDRRGILPGLDLDGRASRRRKARYMGRDLRGDRRQV